MQFLSVHFVSVFLSANDVHVYVLLSGVINDDDNCDNDDEIGTQWYAGAGAGSVANNT